MKIHQPALFPDEYNNTDPTTLNFGVFIILLTLYACILSPKFSFMTCRKSGLGFPVSKVIGLNSVDIP